MKILYVDLQYDYGKKERGLNQIGEFGFHQVFKKLGHDVVCFYYDDYLSRLDDLQTHLLNFADQESPDLIYFCLYTDQFRIETLQKLKAKYRTINWFGDDQWRFENFTSKYATSFTYVITTDFFSLPKYQKLGCQNIFLSQWAALNRTEVELPDQSYLYDVSFVGGYNSIRHWFMDELKKLGISVSAFGFGWPLGPVSLERMDEIFRRSRINLNLSNSNSFDIRYFLHHYKNSLRALRSSKSASQIKARNFEIPYYGGFQLTDYVPTLEKYFKIGQEIVCYANIDEAAQLIHYYLQNETAREEIKRASIQRARQEHSYLHRLQDILSQL